IVNCLLYNATGEYIRVLLCFFSAFYCVSCNQVGLEESDTIYIILPPIRLPLKKDNAHCPDYLWTVLFFTLHVFCYTLKIMFTFPYIFAIMYKYLEI
ncbi:hypothetical protein ACJX0J_023875, partial [Zea mays]